MTDLKTDAETAVKSAAETADAGLIARVTAHPRTVLSVIAALALVALAAILL